MASDHVRSRPLHLIVVLVSAAIFFTALMMGLWSPSSKAVGASVLAPSDGQAQATTLNGRVPTSHSAGLSGPVKINYQFVTGPALTATPRRANAFMVSSPVDAKDEAYHLAQGLGFEDRAFSHYLFTAGTNLPVWHHAVDQFGSSSGPHVMTFSQWGVVTWGYQGSDISPAGNAPSAASATRWGQMLFKKLRVWHSLDVISTSRYKTLMTVNFDDRWESTTPSLGGEPGLSYVSSVTYGPGGYLVDAYGQEIAPFTIGSYPAISAVQAVNVLRRTNFYYPVAVGATAASSTTTIAVPPTRITLTSGTLGLATLVARNGRTIFVPTWYLKGGGETFSVVAIDPRLLNFSTVVPSKSP